MLMTVAGRYGDMRHLADAYREAYQRAGHDPAGMIVAALAYVHVQPSGDAARSYWHPYRDNYRAFTAVLKESKVLTRGIQALYEQIGPAGFANREPDFCGSPSEVTAQVLKADADLGGIDRLLCLTDCGGIPAQAVLDSVERFSTEVMPTVKATLA
jgi:alkanesulfonate monooxygenase SsuD/methylene tetrahydromethanopterin reductase-like flavin-dependent oxidoreductase (luciferase family)